MTNIRRAYQTSSAEGATHIGLLLSVYDALAEDILLAGEAAERGDISGRCQHSQHGLLLLGHLEDWVSLLDDPGLQQTLAGFYAYVRGEVLRLQASQARAGFVELAMRISETRAAWHKKESQAVLDLQNLNGAADAGSGGAETSGSCWFG